MTFLEIEAFLNIAQYGSFSAAAENCILPSLRWDGESGPWKRNWDIRCL